MCGNGEFKCLGLEVESILFIELMILLLEIVEIDLDMGNLDFLMMIKMDRLEGENFFKIYMYVYFIKRFFCFFY